MLNNTISFKGYDARRLRGLVMNDNFGGIADEVRKIGKRENFKVFFLEEKDNDCIIKINKVGDSNNLDIWTQDYWGILNDTLLFDQPSGYVTKLMEFFGLNPNKVQVELQEKYNLNKIKANLDYLCSLAKTKKVTKEIDECTDSFLSAIDFSHVKGGNYFITRGLDGMEEVLIGADELKTKNLDDLKLMFQTDRIHIIPQADFHIDLFIRPLTNKKVLLADDKMMIGILKQQLTELKKLAKNAGFFSKQFYNNLLEEMGILIKGYQKAIKSTPYAKTDEVAEALKNAGYYPIRVPSRIFHLDDSIQPDGLRSMAQKNLHNYMNAHALINDRGELVYITNKSSVERNMGFTDKLLKKIGVSLENVFMDKVKAHVEKFYFVSGQKNQVGNILLPECCGGIHCASMEVPEKVVSYFDIK